MKDLRGWKKGKSRKFTNYDLRLEIKKIRKDLEKYSVFIGADEVLLKLEENGLSPLPSEIHIAKILRQLGFTTKKKIDKYKHSETYPLDLLVDKEKDLILALDFLGPKTLDTKEIIVGLVTSFNQGYKRLTPIESKTTDELIAKFVDFLRYSGQIPNYIQSDNDTCIMGNVAGQMNFGRFMRLCLNLKITPIFIPEGEPYYNGLAENVISLFAKKIWHPNYFQNKTEVNQAMIKYSDAYCKRLARKKIILPSKDRNYQNSILNDNKYTVKKLTSKLLPESSKEIIFLRFVKEQFEHDYSFINIMGHHIEMPKKYTGFYVAAIYNITKQSLSIHTKINNKLSLIKKIQLSIKI